MWIKLEDSTFEHPKLFALDHGAHGLFVRILCAAKKRSDGGRLTHAYCDPNYWAMLIREPLESVNRWMNDLTQSGLIEMHDDGMIIHNWHKYQTDPTGPNRAKRYREQSRSVTERHCDDTVTACDDSFVTARHARVEKSRVEKSREEKSREDPPYKSPPSGRDDFDAFWKAYPRKIGKAAARRKWQQTRKTRPPLETLLAAIEKQQSSPSWQRDGGAYIPHPTTWLNQGRWDDEPERDPIDVWAEKELARGDKTDDRGRSETVRTELGEVHTDGWDG